MYTVHRWVLELLTDHCMASWCVNGLPTLPHYLGSLIAQLLCLPVISCKYSPTMDIPNPYLLNANFNGSTIHQPDQRSNWFPLWSESSICSYHSTVQHPDDQRKGKNGLRHHPGLSPFTSELVWHDPQSRTVQNRQITSISWMDSACSANALYEYRRLIHPIGQTSL